MRVCCAGIYSDQYFYHILVIDINLYYCSRYNFGTQGRLWRQHTQTTICSRYQNKHGVLCNGSPPLAKCLDTHCRWNVGVRQGRTTDMIRKCGWGVQTWGGSLLLVDRVPRELSNDFARALDRGRIILCSIGRKISTSTTTISHYNPHNHHHQSLKSSQSPSYVTIIITTTTTICHYNHHNHHLSL